MQRKDFANEPSKYLRSEIPLPDEQPARARRRRCSASSALRQDPQPARLLLNIGELAAWNKKHHGEVLRSATWWPSSTRSSSFTATSAPARRRRPSALPIGVAAESAQRRSILFKLSNRVRGSGKVGEMGTLIADAFQKVVQSAGKHRRAILIIDEGDSLAAQQVAGSQPPRGQGRGQHADPVHRRPAPVRGRMVVFLCTNRLSVLDPALRRRAAIMEEFKRPGDEERRQLLRWTWRAWSCPQPRSPALVSADGRNGSARPGPTPTSGPGCILRHWRRPFRRRRFGSTTSRPRLRLSKPSPVMEDN